MTSPRGVHRYLSTLPTAVLLAAALSHGILERVHARLLSTGEAIWPGYNQLRVDPQPPDCELITEPPPQRDDELDELLQDTPADASPDGDLLDDLLGEGSAAPGLHPDAIAAANRRCLERRALHQRTVEAITPAVRAFRALETTVAACTHFATNHLPHFLILLFLIGAATATWTGGHIALRAPKTRTQARVRAAGELIANGLLLLSSIALWRVQISSGVTIDAAELHPILVVGFTVTAGIALWKLLRPAPELSAGGSALAGLLTVPLYATMAQIAGLYFLLVEHHGAGLAIQLGKLSEHALLYIHVGLYVWAGMLLKQSRISDLVLEVGRPWRLSPEPMALAIVALAALPTAYSGASGILVIAAGSLIYQKLREAGSRSSLAMATTAMAGSTGVVLSPCLLVVIVASLNKEVTTQELYGAGIGVFLLTLLTMAAVLWLARRQPWSMAAPREALPQSLQLAGPLMPYAAIFAASLLLFHLGLDARLDEHSAPVLLPFILLLLLAYDQSARRRSGSSAGAGFSVATTEATRETVSHIGALLTLMGLSVGLGGVVERGELMSLVPDHFGSPWVAMSAFVFVLVIVGMTMDPYGAVILVSATFPRLVAQSGIEPVHFWMVVLVAFELGYLTPPVALNHLLTRRVVADSEADEAEARSGSLWLRHERLLLPVAVIGLVLLVVAFGPLVVRSAIAGSG